MLRHAVGLSLLLATCATAHAGAAVNGAATTPGFVDKKGNFEAVDTQCLKSDKCDKKWLTLAFPDYQGPRPRVAVMEVANQSADAANAPAANQTIRVEFPGLSRAYGDATVPVSGLEDLLTKTLFETRRFRMVERQKIDTALDEQDFGAGGRVTAESATRIGKVLGAEYLVAASINEFTPDYQQKGVAGGVLKGVGSGLGIGGIGANGTKAKVVLTIRIFDAATGEILDIQTVEGTAGSSGLTLGAGALGGSFAAGAIGGQKKNEPVAYALQVCMNKAAYLIAGNLRERPFSAPVAMVDGQEIAIAGGADAGLRDGMVLDVFSRGKAIVNPETGELLGVKETRIGAVQVVSVDEKASYVRIIEGCAGIKEKDIVKARPGAAH